MVNAVALVVANSVDLNTANFQEKQTEVKEPVVLFLKDNELFKSYRIYARTIEDIEFMNKHKVFYTFDVPEYEVEKLNGAVFYGVDEKRKELTAVDGVLQEEIIY